MAVDVTMYLSVGDGATSDYIDLNNDAGNFTLAFWDPGVPFSGRNRNGNRNVLLGINIEDASITAVWDRVRNLQTKLGQARLAAANPQGGHTGVTLGVQIGSASNMVYFDIVDGTATIQRSAFSVSMEQGAIEFSGQGSGVVIELECLPYARGDAVTLSGSPFTLNKAGLFSFYEAAIPGDVPALATYTITDNSSAVVMNKILIGHKSQPDLDSGDWDPVLDVAASGNGSDTGSITDAIDSDYAGDASVLYTDGWSELAEALPGTAYADQAGTFDVWARVYDSLSKAHRPRNITSGNVQTTGSMPAGNYTFVVTSIISGDESPPSDAFTFIMEAPNDRITIDWDAPIIGTPTDYRVYWKRDSQDWKYLAVGGATTQRDMSTESGATTADPPSQNTVKATTFRGRLSLSSGTTVTTGKAVTPALSNGQYELVKLFSGVTLPPIALEEGGSVEQWRIAIDAHRNDPGTVPGARVDALWVLPSESIVEAEYLPQDLATARKWVIGRTRHGNPHGMLRSKADNSEQGTISVSNPPVLGPGDTQGAVAVMVAGGVSNVGGASLSMAVEIVPRYTMLRGS